MKSRAAIDPTTLAILAGLALLAALTAPSGGRGQRHFWQFWKKDPIAETQKAQAAVDAGKQAVNEQREKQLRVAQDAANATGAAIDAAQARTAAGTLPVKELETA